MNEPDYDDLHPPVSGHCDNCGDCEVVRRDHGFSFEYWGSTGVHYDMRDCCSECGDEI